MRWPWNHSEPTNNDILERIQRLERRQELLEDFTDQKLDMMRGAAARIEKRARDAAKAPRTHEPEATDVETQTPALARLAARRAARLALRRPSDLGQ